MIPLRRNVAGCGEEEPHETSNKKRGEVLNKNINSAKYDYVTIMEIKKIKICFPKRHYSLHLGFKLSS